MIIKNDFEAMVPSPAGGDGHACGVRVQRVQKVQRVQRGRYRRFAADFEKGARLTAQVRAARGGGLCRRVVFTDAQGLEVKRFLRLTGLRPEGS